MLSTLIALIAATSSAGVPPATAARGPAYDAITAAYDVDRDVYCLRTGASSLTFRTRRPTRPGACLSAAQWRRRGVAFEAPVARRIRRTATQTASR